MCDLLPLFLQANPSTARCVSWDFVSDSWITDGCTTEVVNETTFRCSCTHLTNFGVLVVSSLINIEHFVLIADHVTYTANDIPQMQSCDCTLNVLLHS